MNAHQQNIYNHLLDWIIREELLPNERIPTEKELGEMFNTNRMNAHLAVKQLECSGLLFRNKSRGTFVCSTPDTKKIGELKSINTNRVCVIRQTLPHITQIHWNSRINNVFEEKLSSHGIEIVFEDIAPPAEKKEFLDRIKSIAETGYNSLLLITGDTLDSAIYEAPDILFYFHDNVFIFDRGTSSIWQKWPYNVVSFDSFREGVLVSEYLEEKGYQNIVFANILEKKPYWLEERIRGLKYGHKRISSKANLKILADIAGDEEKLFSEIKSLKGKCAIVAPTDHAAATIYAWAGKRNLLPGKDFGLIGFDNNSEFRGLNLTTVSPPLEKVGSRLAELIINNVKSKKQRKELVNVRIESEIIQRRTC